MRIYLAARFGRRDELNVHRLELQGAGHTVTSRWLDQPDESNRPDLPPSVIATQALGDIEDLFRSDCCISFTDFPRTDGAGRGGRHVEFGIALAVVNRLIVVGPREHIFHFHPRVEPCSTWSGVRRLLDLKKERS